MSRLPAAALVAALLVLAALPAAATAAANPWLSQRILVQAHQGGEDEYPSNTMYALRSALRDGADMLELDVGATKDGRVVVLHDNTVDRVTNGHGSVTDMTLAEVQRLDAAYWFVPGRNAVHGLPASRYPLRGVRTGARRPPKDFSRADFRIATLDEVLRAFPRTPMNVEIKGRDGGDQAVFDRTADLLAGVLRRSRRTDVIVTSFNQKAIDRFHALAPAVPLAPGIDGTANFILANGSPGPNVVAFQVPITFRFGGQLLTITTPDFVARAHEAGYAVHVWLSDDGEDVATYRRLLGMCVDGIMAARPKLLLRHLRKAGVAQPGGPGADPCTSRAARRATSTAKDVAVTLARRGASPEARRGTLELRATGRDGARKGALLGRAPYVLEHGQARVDVRVALNAGARAALRRHGRMRVMATTTERGAPLRTTLVIRRRA
jgi:glycerophosphoryl diester phosphodiesterase